MMSDFVEIVCESNTYCTNKIKITPEEFKRRLQTNEYTLCEDCKLRGHK